MPCSKWGLKHCYVLIRNPIHGFPKCISELKTKTSLVPCICTEFNFFTNMYWNCFLWAVALDSLNQLPQEKVARLNVALSQLKSFLSFYFNKKM